MKCSKFKQPFCSWSQGDGHDMFLLLWRVGLCWPRDGWMALPRGLSLRVNAWKNSFHMQATSRAHIPNHLHYWAFYIQGWYLIWIIPLPGARQLVPQGPEKFLKLANPKPVYPASSTPSCRDQTKVFCSHLPPFPSASWPNLVLPHMALCGLA